MIRARPAQRQQAAATGILTLYALLVLGPLVLVVVNSLRSTAAIYARPIGLPTMDGIANYAAAWSQARFSTYFVNSVLVTVASLVVGVGAATLAGYGLGRYRFAGHEAVGSFFLAGLLLPAQLGVVPLFYLLRALGLIDSLAGLTLIYAAHTLPLSTFLLAGFFRQLPVELEEAARLDGARELRIFTSIMLPLVRPALMTVIVVQCAPIWNDFFYPLVMIRSNDHFTLPVGLSSFVDQYQSDYGGLFAALVIVSLPLILLFVLANRHVIAGLTAGIGK
jgi:raffinose/stachyose/melibiose transport system permease protein